MRPMPSAAERTRNLPSMPPLPCVLRATMRIGDISLRLGRHQPGSHEKPSARRMANQNAPNGLDVQPSPSGDGIGFPTCKKHRDRRICQEIGNQQTFAECGDDKPPAEMPGIMLTTPMVPQKYGGYKQGLDGFGVGIHPQQFGLDSSVGWLFQTSCYLVFSPCF